MKIKISLLAIISMICISIGSNAQDIHFSQFYESPLNLNPAMTGVMNCNQRFVANYRNQWASALGANAYNTYSVSYDQKVAVGRTDYFGIGGSFWGDVAGASKFGTTQARLSFAYSKQMSGDRKSAHFLVIGADAALSQRRISPNDLRWPSQHDGNGGQNTDPGPPIADSNFMYPDLAAGIMWFSLLNESNSFYVGAAAHHLNRANVSFLGETVGLYSRYTIHGGAELAIAPKISLLPGAIAMFQGPHREINTGTSVRFAMGGGRVSSQFFQLGVWYRLGTKNEGGIHSDALILSTRFDYDNYGFGFSYDMTTSKFKQAGSANGSFELSMKYLICGPEKRGVYCPRF